ncbi:related to U1 snRNP protein [Cephalotrichum gorgonifer]|uniref:Related to U1 snRNP protein n=1 Tax=Cephalotrichum gorgonifer TaxID=2041049 RepID=A0AAE8N1Q7_9PEZI|nr:related to U1 snRNP protein [Cephalotrichum gorgonifer]
MTDRTPTLKSTYKPSPGLLAPLLPGWTEHKAPTGHTYYYNAATKESTYKRPAAIVPAAAPPPPAGLFPQIPNLSNPAVANAFLASRNAVERPPPRRDADRPKPPQPTDKPKSREAIPGCEPWVLVHTKYGRRFVYNPDKNASYWRIPEKLMGGVLELDRARVAAKVRALDAEKEGAGAAAAGAATGANKEEVAAGPRAGPESRTASVAPATQEADEDSDEYEEVEVTDDEGADESGGGDDGDEHRAKRQRTEDEQPEDMAMSAEEEMAMQLELMAQEQALEQGDYYEEEEELPEFSEEDARELFKDLLSDYKINPYSTWENLIEQGKIVEDPRYTVLPTTKARKEVWEEWSRVKIHEQKEAKAREEKPDPRVEYIKFLEGNATPKLYWPEFKRKFRKEACMRSFDVTDKEREKWYREFIAKLKLPQATLKSELTALMKSVPLAVLNRSTDTERLPGVIRGDVRYAALPAAARDPLVEAYVQSLPPAPGAREAEEEEVEEKEKDARRRRERALEERNRVIAERKEREGREREAARRRLREGEMEIERAMAVGRRG